MCGFAFGWFVLAFLGGGLLAHVVAEIGVQRSSAQSKGERFLLYLVVFAGALVVEVVVSAKLASWLC